MNVTVKMGGVITLPADVVEVLNLEPGSEIAFGRAAEGKFVIEKVPGGDAPTRAQIRARLETVAKAARANVAKEFADMTTDEFMGFLRD